VHSVVGHAPGDHEANGWHVQDGSVVGVGVPGLNRLDTVALQLESLGRDRLGQHRPLRDEAGEDLVP
jgi:hypothetical protein